MSLLETLTLLIFDLAKGTGWSIVNHLKLKKMKTETCPELGNQNQTKLLIAFVKPLIKEAIETAIDELKATPLEPQTDLIFMDEACRITGLKKATIYVKVHQKEIPFTKRGNRLYFSRKALLSWILD